MKPETEIRNLKRSLRQYMDRCREAELEVYKCRVRATKAEQEAAEWKARFDVLLRRECGPQKGSGTTDAGSEVRQAPPPSEGCAYGPAGGEFP